MSPHCVLGALPGAGTKNISPRGAYFLLKETVQQENGLLCAQKKREDGRLKFSVHKAAGEGSASAVTFPANSRGSRRLCLPCHRAQTPFVASEIPESVPAKCGPQGGTAGPSACPPGAGQPCSVSLGPWKRQLPPLGCKGLWAFSQVTGSG